MGQVIAFVIYSIGLLIIGSRLQVWKQKNIQFHKKVAARHLVKLPKNFNWEV